MAAHFFHCSDGGAVTGNSVALFVLFQFLEDVLEQVSTIAGQKVRQLGADILIDVDIGYVSADDIGDSLHAAAIFLDDD